MPVIFFIGVLTFSLIFQGSRGIWEPDEGRYTNIAAQMLKSGDYLYPSFNDDLHHFAKPPMTYWAISMGIKLLGWNEWGARLPNALAFSATIMLIYLIGIRLVPARPWLPAVIYGTSLMPYCASNIVTTDTILTLWETVAVLGAVLWLTRQDGTRGRVALFLIWSGFALAFLTKGPPGLLPLLAILAFIALTKGWREIFRMFTIEGIAVFAIIGCGWYIAVASSHPGVMNYFFKQEVFDRIASSSVNRNARWYKPFVIYLPTLLAGTIPWNIPLLRTMPSLSAIFSRSWWSECKQKDPWTIFLILWTVLPLIAFFVSKSRLPLYILPLFVPISIATARLIGDKTFNRRTVTAFGSWILILFALKWGWAQYPYKKDSRQLAKAITVSTATCPREIVFVDMTPMWGLNLYLKSEIEQVVNTHDKKTALASEEDLSEELIEREPKTLLVVEEKHSADVFSKLKSFNYQPKILNRCDSNIIIAID